MSQANFNLYDAWSVAETHIYEKSLGTFHTLTKNAPHMFVSIYIHKYFSHQGRGQLKKKTFSFGHCPNKGGGIYPCPDFWPPFLFKYQVYQVIAFKMAISLLKLHSNCILFSHFCHNYHQNCQNYHHNYIPHICHFFYTGKIFGK